MLIKEHHVFYEASAQQILLYEKSKLTEKNGDHREIKISLEEIY